MVCNNAKPEFLNNLFIVPVYQIGDGCDDGLLLSFCFCSCSTVFGTFFGESDWLLLLLCDWFDDLLLTLIGNWFDYL